MQKVNDLFELSGGAVLCACVVCMFESVLYIFMA